MQHPLRSCVKDQAGGTTIVAQYSKTDDVGSKGSLPQTWHSCPYGSTPSSHDTTNVTEGLDWLLRACTAYSTETRDGFVMWVLFDGNRDNPGQ